MSDSLADLLARKDFDEPPEIRAIKRFVRERYDSDVEVLVRERDIIITTTSASLANTLRLHLSELRKAAGTDKRLVFRIR